MSLYKLELTERAQTAGDSISKPEERRAVDGALAQSEINPKDLEIWTRKRDPSGMCICARKNDDWMISIPDAGRTDGSFLC
jgi:hypothetical protein